MGLPKQVPLLHPKPSLSRGSLARQFAETRGARLSKFIRRGRLLFRLGTPEFDVPKTQKHPVDARVRQPLPFTSGRCLNSAGASRSSRASPSGGCAVNKSSSLFLEEMLGGRSRTCKKMRYLRGSSAAATLREPSAWTHLVGHPNRSPQDLFSLPTFPPMSLVRSAST